MGTDSQRPASGRAALMAFISRERWGLLVAALFLAGGAIAYATTPAAWRPGSDGYYSYLYARSLAFDGDIDFTNDYRTCGDPFGLGVDRGTGHPDNIFYVGPALLWTPVLLVMRLIGLSGNGCGLPWTLICLGLTTLVGAAASLFTYAFLSAFFSRGLAALAVALTLFGGPALLFAGALPSYGHLYELAFSSLFGLACVRSIGSPSHRWFVCLALTLAALILQRASNLSFVLLPVVLASSRGESQRFRLMAATAGGLLLGAGPVLLINAYLYDSFFTFSHGPYFLNLEHAHPWLTLFDAEEGVFLYWPAVWPSLFGLFFVREPKLRLFARALGAIALILLLINSSAIDWAPARRFLSLAPFFALGIAALLARITDKLGKPDGPYGVLAAGAIVLPLWSWSLGFTWGASRGYVELGKPQTQASLYGGGITAFWMLLDRTVGTVPILPAELWTAARYGVDHRAFGDAAFPRWYVRDFRTLEWQGRRIDLDVLTQQRLTEGLSPATSRGAMRMKATTARAIFATQWPFVTHLLLGAESAAPTRVRVGSAHRGDTWWSEWKALSGKQQLVFNVQAAELSSGIQELLIQEEGKTPTVTLRSLELDDRAERHAIAPERALQER